MSKNPPKGTGTTRVDLDAYWQGISDGKPNALLILGKEALETHVRTLAPSLPPSGATSTHITTGQQSLVVWGFTTENSLARQVNVSGSPAGVTVTGVGGASLQLLPPSPATLLAEAQAALNRVPTDGVAAEREIVAQASSPELAIAISLNLNPAQKPNTVTLIDAALGAGGTVLHEAKRLLDVTRPSRVAGVSGTPLIPIPGHASYPSGHAFAAYTLAELLKSITIANVANPTDAETARKQRLDALAARIADNRIAAGLHTDSDTTAGRNLGQWFAALLLSGAMLAAVPEWNRLVTAARGEW